MPNYITLPQQNKWAWFERAGAQTGNMLSQMAMAQYAQRLRAQEAAQQRQYQEMQAEQEMNIKLQLAGYGAVDANEGAQPGDIKYGGQIYRMRPMEMTDVTVDGKTLGKMVYAGGKLQFVENQLLKQREEDKPTTDERNFERAQKDPAFARWYQSKPQWGADPNRARDQQLQELQATNQLSNEFNNRSKEFLTVRDAYNRIKASAQEPSAAGDLALIFSYMKILDPGSTVREGEFANAQNAASIPERIRAMYNKTISGERLSEATRNDFLKRSDMLYGAQEKTHKQLRGEFESKAKRFGLNPQDVVTDYLKPAEPASTANRAEAPQEAIEFLKKNPDLREAFKIKYGYLPEGF